MQPRREQAAATPRLGRYEIDTSASTITFRTRHLFGLAPVRGGFAIRTGMVDVTEPLAEASVHAEIETASFRTGNGPRDDTVRSARFLDAGRHPVMMFVAAGVDDGVLTGTLTVRGVARPVSLSIERPTVAPRSFTVRATTRIDRTEFGVTASRGLTGRYLDVSVAVRCVRT
ncbi:MAG: YceI family protein [Actinomadura sp.]